MHGSVAFGVGVLSLLVQVQPTDRSQNQPIRSHVNVVRVDVSVLDKNRIPVEDLTASDFTIRDEGVTRPIVAFSMVSLTSVAGREGAAGDSPSRDATGSPLTAPADRGRLVAILFDRTIPAGEGTIIARQAATALVNGLSPNDFAAVLRSSGLAGEGISQEFTRDRSLLLRAIASPFIGMTSPPAMTSGGLTDGARLQQTGECGCGLCSLEVVGAVAHAMQNDFGRRKMLVFIGSDMPFITAAPDCGSRVREARERMFREVDLSNLTVHVLDPTGLEAGGVPAGSFSHSVNATVRTKINDRAVRQGNLAVLPDRTGGRLVTNANDLKSFADRILNESRSYYLLGFEPAATASDGKPRQIEVTVNRPGIRVIARKSYVVPDR